MRQHDNIPVDRMIEIASHYAAIGSYLLVRDRYGRTVGVNPRLVTLSNIRMDRGKKSNFVSFRPIGLQEYISNKVPFITTKK